MLNPQNGLNSTSVPYSIYVGCDTWPDLLLVEETEGEFTDKNGSPIEYNPQVDIYLPLSELEFFDHLDITLFGEHLSQRDIAFFRESVFSEYR
jgi:hypothetical protein